MSDERTELEQLRKLKRLKELEARAGTGAPKSGSFDLADPVAPAEGNTFRGAGASGGWGYPDPGPLGAIATKFGQGAAKDGFDEGVGALAAMEHGSAPGALRMPDGSEVQIRSGEDMYRAGRDFTRQEQEAADQHWPKLGFGAQMLGEGLGDFALAGPKAVGRGYQTLAGLARGLNMSDAELTPDRMTPWTAGEAALSSLVGGAIGNQAPVLMSKVANSGAAKYLGSKADDALTYSGDRLKGLAGWLKINSLHPVPTGSEAMASLPGGTVGVGQELLERNIGGWTKKATAEQIEHASGKANGAIGELVDYHDAAGGPPIDVRGAIAAGRAKAQELLDEPTTKAIGRQMMGLVEEYEAKFSQGTGTARDILGMKRALGKAAYGESQKLKRAGDQIAGELGKGLSVFERATDDAMDAALGPRFEAANLLSRQMRGASEAADRTAARTQGNGLIPIKPLMAMAGMGGAGLVGGAPAAIPAAVAMWLGDKYGAQLGARGAWAAGRALQSLPRAAQFAAQHASPAPIAQEMLSSTRGSTLADLLEMIRQPRASPTPAFAMEGE